MASKSWIINCLKKYKISYEFINVIEKNLKTSREALTAAGRSIAEAKIQRGIYQGDALSPLLFIIVIIPLNHIFRKCIADTNLVDRRKRNQSFNVHG